MKTTIILPSALLLLATGCIGHKIEYTPPAARKAVANSIELDMPKSEAWTKGIKALAKDVFVINNMDQASGLLNISYSGAPEAFVDGGELYFMVSNARGQRDYRFPAASDHREYEVSNGQSLAFVKRDLSLDGRANLIIEDAGPGKSRVTVNVMYVLTLKAAITPIGLPTQYNTDTISFTTGGEGRSRGGTLFRPTGELETRLLAAFKPHP